MISTTAIIKIRNNSGIYDFELVSGNGEAVLFSEQFRSLFLCREAAKELPRLCSDAVNYERKDVPGGQYYFVINDDKGERFATSQKFWSMTSRNYAMMVVRREAENAMLID